MMKIILTGNDGSGSEELLATDNLGVLAEFLRRASATYSLTPEVRQALLSRAEKATEMERSLLQVVKVEKARAGERVWGEPCVLLKVSDDLRALEYRVGDEITLGELDSATDHKYAASQMALQRAKKEKSAVGVLFKNSYAERRANSEVEANSAKAAAAALNAAYAAAADGPEKERLAAKCAKANERADRAEENAAEYLEKFEAAEARTVKFCRLSDLSQVMEEFPDAVQRPEQKHGAPQ